MAEFSRELSQEYWRPAPSAGNQFSLQSFPPQAKEAFCVTCGAPYAVGARFCHLCGSGRTEDLHRARRSTIVDWFDLDALRKLFGLSTASLVFVSAAAMFLLAAAMTGLLYTTSTLAEWQAVQTWRIEWLLATVAALLSARLFKNA